jgi:DNA-binding SARP family transcriptional activator
VLTLRQPHADIEKWCPQALLPPQDPFTANITAHMMFALISHYVLGLADVEKAGKILAEAEKFLVLPFVTPQVRLIVKALSSLFYMSLGVHTGVRQTITDALDLSDTSGIKLYSTALAGYYVCDSLRTNDIISAEKRLDEIEAFVGSLNKIDKIWYYFSRARLSLITGKLRHAAIHAEIVVDLSNRLGWQITKAISRIQYALILHATSKLPEAEDQLAKADELIRRHHLRFARLHYLLTHAYFDLDTGQRASGLRLLEKGLAHGRTIGMIPHIADDPAATTRLCIVALENQIEVEYTRKIIQNRNLVADPPPLHLDNWPWTIRIHMFGAFNLVIDDQPVQFSRKAQQKPLDMLKIIVAFGGRKVREESIADELWPDADGDQAHRSFATTLHRLRKLIGYPKAIRLADHRITLDPRYCWVDTQAFKYMYQQLLTPDKEQSDITLDKKKFVYCQRIMDLYPGHFLEDESWAGRFIVQKEKFHHLFLDVVKRLGRYWETNHQWEKAISCYQKGLDRDPLAENLYGRLMNCHDRLGQTSEALKVYERSKKILHSSLGRSPSREIETMYEALTKK